MGSNILLLLSLTFMLNRCEIHSRFSLKTQPCDIYQNATLMTVVVNCQGRRLKEIPRILPNTTSLDLSENLITNITGGGLQNLVNLTSLNLNWVNKNKKILSANLSKDVLHPLTKLQIAKLNGLLLTAVPPDLPKDLQVLYLTENKIVSLTQSTFIHLKNLRALYLSNNCYYWNPCPRGYSVSTGSFSTLTNLNHLTLSYNNLTEVPQSLPVSLKTLELASNRIAHIREQDFQNLTNLTALEIQGNCPRCNNAPYPCVPCKNGSIEIHPQAFASLVELRLLHLAGNSIKSVHSSWFQNLQKLEKLFLSYNYLFDAVMQDNFLINLPMLQKLDLSFNFQLKVYKDTIKLSSSFSNLTSLQILHIQGLVFQEISNDSFKSLFGLQNLTILDAGVNFIVHAKSDIFQKLQHVKLIYLSENRLYPVDQESPRDSLSSLGEDVAYSPDKMSVLELYSHKNSFQITSKLVKAECYAAGRVLDLSRNNIFFISPAQFKGYGNISCLNLSRNGFSSALNGTEFTSLPGLKYLDLSFNKIDLAYDYAFQELQELEVLDLSFNPHYFIVQGVTHNLNFLKHLPNLKVLNMSSNSIFTLTTKEMFSKSLLELQFQHNNLHRLWRVKDQTYEKLFKGLTMLAVLDISYNSIDMIPLKVFQNLPVSIQRLKLSHNCLTSVNWTRFGRFKSLKELILSNNNIYSISGNLSADVPSLQLLNLHRNRIFQLSSGFLSGAVNLVELDLSRNLLTNINQSTFPSESERYLKKLWLNDNPFRCTCDMLEFVLWLYSTDIKIPKLVTSVTCAAPEERKGNAVILFDVKECIDNQKAFLAYFMSTMLILCTTVVAVGMHMFYWDVSYIYYYLKARLTGYEHLSSDSCVYDAFITYDTQDPQVSDWVLSNLRMELEEHSECLRPICLEERDWMPGSAVLDNLTWSIQHSRKTVFVLTEGYVNSGAFKLALFLAHQRLLEESEDVIVLLFLEPVLQYSHFLRLRKRLCGRSVLRWPRSPSAEAWFWQSLRNAIRVDNQAMYSDLYTRYFTTK